MKLTASVAALLLGSTAMAQTAAPAPAAEAAPAPAAPAAAAPAPAPAPAAPAFKFAMKGFVSMTGGYQTGTFNNEGQLSNFAKTPETLKDDLGSTTFDVRHSRFNFSVQGPQTMFGATPTGILEIDFMGGFGAGANGSASLVNRLRIAVAELNWGNHKLQFGQQNDLIFAMAPTSLSHIGQPIGYSTGNSGWRRPGIFGYHTTEVAPGTKVELAWEVGRGNWDDAGGIGGGAVTAPANGIAAAEASALPAFAGRATVTYGKLLNLWAASHYQQVDLSGVGAGAPITGATVRTLGISSYNAGAKVQLEFKPVTLTLQGTGFVGQNAGPLTANFGSYRMGTAAKPDVASMGYWAQAGVGYDKFTLWCFYGAQKIDEKDFARSTNATAAAPVAFENATTNVALIYRDGGWGFGAEWLNFATEYAKTVDATAEKVLTKYTAKADQYLLTANYFF